MIYYYTMVSAIRQARRDSNEAHNLANQQQEEEQEEPIEDVGESD